MKLLFLHGLDSSSKGTKGSYFKKNFPHINAPDFQGDLETRMQALEQLSLNWEQLVIIGSSFGGLMATCYAQKYPSKIKKLILLAPALNFPEFSTPKSPIQPSTLLVIGKDDTVTPPDIVIPRAQATFANLVIEEVSDDHMLHATFYQLEWQRLLSD